MPIPDFNAHGLLPEGLYPCTLEELKFRFGTFNDSDRRVRLFHTLLDLIAAVKRSGLFKSLLIDGSFVTRKAAPNDIDIIALLHSGHDFERDLPVSEYSLVSRSLLRRRFGFDVLIAEVGSEVYSSYLEFFSRVREAPELRKGFLQIDL